VPFPSEKAPTQKISEGKGIPHNEVVISQLLNYPVRGLVFEGGNTIKDLSDAVASSCICLQTRNIPFNVLISDCGKRVFLFPQVVFLSFCTCYCTCWLVCFFAFISCSVNYQPYVCARHGVTQCFLNSSMPRSKVD